MTVDEASNNIEAGRQHWLAPLMLQAMLGAVMLSATAALTLACVLLSEKQSTWGMILGAAMSLSQGTLLAIWVVWAGRASPWRFVALYVALVGGLAVLEWPIIDSHRYYAEAGHLIWVTALQMAMASLAFFLLRFVGIEISRHPLDAAGEPSRQWVQFSLAAMLEWTAGLAIVLAASHYLPDSLEAPNIEVFLAYLFPLTLVGASSVWAVLGTRRPIARTLVLLFLLVTATAIILSRLGPSDTFWELAGFLTAHIVYLLIALGVVRWLGYRLVWRRRVWI
jgi:hypothetical protein